MKGPVYFATILVFVLSLAGCRSPERSGSLLIATSSNLQFVMEPLLEAFTQESGIPCEQVVGSSGKLTAQVVAGAPYDIFLSADLDYPEELYRKGLTTEAPHVYAYGSLVLWSLRQDPGKFTGEFIRESNGVLALPNPSTAPYGKAGKQALADRGLWEALQDHVVYGESISQVNQFVSSGAATYGLTAESIVRAPRLKGKGKWIPFPGSADSSLAQGYVILKKGPADAAHKAAFISFLTGPEASRILSEYGYSLPADKKREKS